MARATFPITRSAWPRTKPCCTDYIARAHCETGVTFVGRLGTYRYLDMDVTNLARRWIAPRSTWKALRMTAPCPLSRGAMTRARVCAVVVTFDRLDKLNIALDRLLAEPLDHIVVVDNASTDGNRRVSCAG